jgi:membrane associated rhomboid family serine protease
MGIQDRDYYRNEGPSVFGSLVPKGIICRWLIGINVVIFILQMIAFGIVGGPENANGADTGSGWMTDWFILDVDKVLGGQVWRLVTYAFLHSPMDIWHVVFNMLFLWWFGSDIEELYGRKEFIAIYLVSALLGGLAYFAWGLAADGGKCLGASGCVSTMLILCALHYPKRIIQIFFFFPMPIWLFAILNVAKDAWIFLAGMQGHVGVAVVVHLAGAAFAVAYFKWQGSFTSLLGGLMWWTNARRARPRLKLFDPDEDGEEPVAVTASSNPAQGSVDEHLEAKLDAVLEKIATKGKDSLTEQEQEILKQAAEMYKKRRS